MGLAQGDVLYLGKAHLPRTNVTTHNMKSLTWGLLLQSQLCWLEHKYHWQEKHIKLLLGINVLMKINL